MSKRYLTEADLASLPHDELRHEALGGEDVLPGLVIPLEAIFEHRARSRPRRPWTLGP